MFSDHRLNSGKLELKQFHFLDRRKLKALPFEKNCRFKSKKETPWMVHLNWHCICIFVNIFNISGAMEVSRRTEGHIYTFVKLFLIFGAMKVSWRIEGYIYTFVKIFHIFGVG